MTIRTLLWVGLGLLAAGAAQAQDARVLIQNVAQAMGTGKVDTIEYGGKTCPGAAPPIEGQPSTVCARISIMGQSYIPGKVDPLYSDYNNWPHVEPNEFRGFIDYNAKAARREVAVVQGRYQPLGGGDLPIVGERRLIEYVNGNYTWDLRNNAPVAVFGHDGPLLFGSAADFRQLEIWLSPHGFVKAALAAQDATIFTRTEFNEDATAREWKVVSFTVLGKYRLTGFINEQNLVEDVETHIPDAVMGDMIHEYVYRGYTNHGGVMFPSQIHAHSGNRFLSWAHDAFNLSVTDVKVNGTAPALTVPDTVRRATVPPVRVETQQLANGVWLLGGAAVSSVAVEFKDWVAIIEAPLNEARSLAVMAEVKRLVPGKPIRYVVNTHHHTDHAGGLRTYLTNGATIITDEANREYYTNIFFYPQSRMLEPDLMSLHPVRTISEGSNILETIAHDPIYLGYAPGSASNTQKYVLTDRARTVEIYPVRGLNHAATMLVAYLPAEKILINSDIYAPRATQSAARKVTKDLFQFRRTIRFLKLDVDRHVCLEGGVGDNAAFQQLFAQPQ